MKKPDYCPEWFDIDLYDNLIDQSRYALSMGLWNRKLNYKRFLEINGEIKTLEERKEYARDLLKAMMRLMEFFDNPTKDNYNPVQEAQGAIVELQLSDVADLFSECYLNHPQMREFFQLATTYFNEAMEHEHTEQMEEWATNAEYPSLEPQLAYTPVSDVSDFTGTFIIDLSNSDEVLKMAFEQKLKEIRAREAAQEQKNTLWRGERTKRFSDAEIRRIVEYRYFAYIDLYVYSLITGRKFTDVEMAAMIYPPRDNTPLDFDAVDRIARTVRPKAIELFERTNPRLLL